MCYGLPAPEKMQHRPTLDLVFPGIGLNISDSGNDQELRRAMASKAFRTHHTYSGFLMRFEKTH